MNTAREHQSIQYHTTRGEKGVKMLKHRNIVTNTVMANDVIGLFKHRDSTSNRFCISLIVKDKRLFTIEIMDTYTVDTGNIIV